MNSEAVRIRIFLPVLRGWPSQAWPLSQVPQPLEMPEPKRPQQAQKQQRLAVCKQTCPGPHKVGWPQACPLGLCWSFAHGRPLCLVTCTANKRLFCLHALFWQRLQRLWPWLRHPVQAVWQTRWRWPQPTARLRVFGSYQFLYQGSAQARTAGPVAGSERWAGILPAWMSSYQSSWCSLAHVSST